ncbi:MarR family winged helix-turn-helix transcriptional regulator [Roseburia sp. 499]|uniref:MarR family winged helix-turn-helix transcriptional regulator n=1 Tax=Roseburia sp. 499 TaxID=1261634 RepID=UPI000951B5D5|nr:MarR family transcriptional regulator [Roseburia sp. 499]WVK68639.1 MarR family transcriptional regulator [Roseburia sp. 499]
MENDNLKIMHTELMEAFHRIQKVNISSMMEVSKGEFLALQIIGVYQKKYPEREGIYVSEIAGNLRIASSQTSRMLKNLEERELIGRSVDTKDRRNTYVFLTENGKEVCQRVHEKMQVYFEGVLNQMGEERMKELIGLCRELSDVMEKELKEQVKENRKNN